MEKITITMECYNSAFEENGEFEVARILRKIADDIELGEQPSFVRDINGNRVGTVTIE